MARHPELTFLSGKVGNEGVYTPQSLFCSLTPAGISFGDALEADYPGFTLPHTNITARPSSSTSRPCSSVSLTTRQRRKRHP